ncbi:Phthalate 4,5-dioxygenase oxygenase reductase subunit [Roseovarius albus]|uniref:Phthalate 4,5-dioxygenase oxygenase reductase subunit n=1 Tax=Roseovarius albus TaxID=1247867 RepID=A0A1X7A757_9RHOB|nr:PDR/VanB family oxidoreductase [Roseovarius albus]SLN70678.1 Phthalate 4,5-dioxygenase oxygenase reductase subunit [Roseovarius albus]
MMQPLLNDVIIAARSEQTENIVSFELQREDGSALPAFSAGSHIDVVLPGEVIRQYSLWNDPSETHRYCLGVLNEPNGRGGSTAMHGMKQGAKLQISAPRNNFELDPVARRSMLFAGGIGITPILSMAQALHDQGAEFELHYCARAPERMAFRDVLEAAPFSDRVQFHFDNGPKAQKLDLDILTKAPDAGTHLYVCGPTGFMDAVLGSAKEAWLAASLHREYFSADAVESDGEDRAFKIQLNSTGDVLDVPADKSIVEVLAEVGIEIPVSCEQGICGTCLTPVLQGTPDHKDLVLTEEEHEDNDQMTLCCSRALTDLLVLDL